MAELCTIQEMSETSWVDQPHDNLIEAMERYLPLLITICTRIDTNTSILDILVAHSAYVAERGVSEVDQFKRSTSWGKLATSVRNIACMTLKNNLIIKHSWEDESEETRLTDFDTIFDKIMIHGDSTYMHVYLLDKHMWSEVVNWKTLIYLSPFPSLSYVEKSNELTCFFTSSEALRSCNLVTRPSHRQLKGDAAILSKQMYNMSYFLSPPRQTTEEMELYESLNYDDQQILSTRVITLLDPDGTSICKFSKFENLITSHVTYVKSTGPTSPGGDAMNLHPLLLPLYLYHLNSIIGTPSTPQTNTMDTLEAAAQAEEMRVLLNPSPGMLETLRWVHAIGGSLEAITSITNLIIDEMEVLLRGGYSTFQKEDLMSCRLDIKPGSRNPFRIQSQSYLMASWFLAYNEGKSFAFPTIRSIMRTLDARNKPWRDPHCHAFPILPNTTIEPSFSMPAVANALSKTMYYHLGGTLIKTPKEVASSPHIASDTTEDTGVASPQVGHGPSGSKKQRYRRRTK